jgi:hypothetical protein
MPFKAISRNEYVVVMRKRFSKWIELVPTLMEICHQTTKALRRVLGKEWSTRKEFYRINEKRFGVSLQTFCATGPIMTHGTTDP